MGSGGGRIAGQRSLSGLPLRRKHSIETQAAISVPSSEECSLDSSRLNVG
jgi:hypothetical protein